MQNPIIITNYKYLGNDIWAFYREDLNNAPVFLNTLQAEALLKQLNLFPQRLIGELMRVYNSHYFSYPPSPLLRKVKYIGIELQKLKGPVTYVVKVENKHNITILAENNLVLVTVNIESEEDSKIKLSFPGESLELFCDICEIPYICKMYTWVNEI